MNSSIKDVTDQFIYNKNVSHGIILTSLALHFEKYHIKHQYKTTKINLLVSITERVAMRSNILVQYF